MRCDIQFSLSNAFRQGLFVEMQQVVTVCSKILDLSVHLPPFSSPAEKYVQNISLTRFRALFSHFVNKRDQKLDASLSRAQLFLSHVILCGHTLLISVTSPWGWVAWRLKNEPNTAATAILNNEHPSVPPPLSEVEKFQRTKQGEKTLCI